MLSPLKMRNNDKDLSSEQKKEPKENESEIPLNSAENEEEETNLLSKLLAHLK